MSAAILGVSSPLAKEITHVTMQRHMAAVLRAYRMHAMLTGLVSTLAVARPVLFLLK